MTSTEIMPHVYEQEKALLKVVTFTLGTNKDPFYEKRLCHIETDSQYGYIQYKKACIKWLGIREEYRKRGYGQLLLHAVCQELFASGCPTIELHVAVTNRAAQKLYEKCNFKRICLVDSPDEGKYYIYRKTRENNK